MNDRELLELAARAAGMQINEQRQAERDSIVDPAKASLWIVDGCTAWNPLIESHHAFILAVQLRLDITFYNGFQEVAAEPDSIVDPAKASLWIVDGCTAWNPLIESHHAFILAVQLRLDITFYNGFQEVAAEPSNGDGMNPCQEVFTENPYAATRRAIVRAAAEIGKSMGGAE